MSGKYQVLAIDEMTRPNPAGGVKHTYRYRILTGSGVRFSVELDDPDPTAEKVKPVLEAKAAEFDKMMNLGK